MRTLEICNMPRSVGACLASAALAVILAGCSHDNPPPAAPPAATPTTVVTNPAPPTSPGAPVASSTAPQTNNTNAGPGGATGNDLGDKVTEAIHINTQMTGSRVTAVADPGGVIRLTGTAQNQQQKALAEREARNTPGVTSVVNKIEIVPTGGSKVASKPKVIEKTTKVYVIQKAAPASSPPSDADDTSSSSSATAGQGGVVTTTPDVGGQTGSGGQ